MFLGQSVILFVDRIQRGRFVFSLLTNGVVFLVSYLIWGLAIAFIGWLMFDVDAKELVIVAALHRNRASAVGLRFSDLDPLYRASDRQATQRLAVVDYDHGCEVHLSRRLLWRSPASA